MYKRIRKTVGVILVLTAILITQIPFTNVSAYSEDFKLSGTKLIQYSGTDETVSVPASVTIIGEEAFANNKNLKSIQIGNQVKEIAYNAFTGCTGLQEVIISDSVEKIGTAAFSNCTDLETVSIGQGVSDYGTGIFAGDTKLKELTIAEGNTALAYENGAIYNKDLTLLYEVLEGREANIFSMPSTVEEIAQYAFWGCDKIQKINLSENLHEIPAFAFSNCKGLQTIEIPYSVRKIQMKAFEDCVSLSEISVPLSVNFIHATAFDGCSGMKANTEAGSYAEEFFQNLNVESISKAEYEDAVNRVIQNALTEEEVAAQIAAEEAEKQEELQNTEETNTEDANGDANSDIPVEEQPSPLEEEGTLGFTTVVGKEAVVFIDNTEQQVFTTADEIIYPENGPDEQDTVGTTESGTVIFTYDKKGVSFPKYTISGDLIAQQAFYLNTGMNGYIIPDSITRIGNFAFARTDLSEIIIPEGVTEIGYGAFYHCDYLADVTIPSSVTRINAYAFTNTKWLNQWLTYSTDQFLIVGDGILLAYHGNKANVVIPEDVKSIAPGVFQDHSEIEAVDLGDGVAKIGADAFHGCTSLKTIRGGMNLVRIEDRAFLDCPLEMIRIPQNVTELGLDCYNLTNKQDSASETYAVFQGLQIPEMIYDEESQRLSNYDYRSACMSGVDYVVISNSISDTNLKGTILEPDGYGYHGLVLSIKTEATNESNGSVSLRLCTMLPDEEGLVEIPDTYTVYGKTYRLTDIDEGAFQYYNTEQNELMNHLTRIILPNSFVNEEEALLNHVNYDYVPDTDLSMNNPVTVRVQSNALKNQDLIDASFQDLGQNYVLWIRESSQASELMKTKYEALYGNTDFSNLTAFDISLYDEYEMVPITKLGRNNMTITIPVPISFNSENIQMMGLDSDGQLESVDFQLVHRNEIECIMFDAYHFSAYAVYEIRVDETLQAGLDNGNLDESPDTGDYFEPKWMIAIGVFVIGVMLFFWKDMRGMKHIVSTKRKTKA